MISLKAQIQKDLKEAVKKKEEVRSLVLRSLSAAILNKEKEKRYKLSKEKPEFTEEELEKESQLTDEEVIEVISSEVKKRKEAILEFEKGERLQPTRGAFQEGGGGVGVHPARKKHILDLVQKEKKELEILQKYLPEQLSEEEIKKLAQEAMAKVEAKEPKDLGKVMAELMPQVKGRAEGSVVSKIVKELLTPSAGP